MADSFPSKANAKDTTAQPTRLDQDVLSNAETPAALVKQDQWQVRYRNRAGRWCQVKATTKQISSALLTCFGSLSYENADRVTCRSRSM